jgi:3'(2'), 5'-bisphosphate nucleotidase
MLHHAFPDDPIVGEEDASDLRTDAGAALRERIVDLANETLTSELELGDNKGWGVGPGQQRSASYLLDAIDRGNHPGGRTGREFLPPPFTSSFTVYLPYC